MVVSARAWGGPMGGALPSPSFHSIADCLRRALETMQTRQGMCNSLIGKKDTSK